MAIESRTFCNHAVQLPVSDSTGFLVNEKSVHVWRWRSRRSTIKIASVALAPAEGSLARNNRCAEKRLSKAVSSRQPAMTLMSQLPIFLQRESVTLGSTGRCRDQKRWRWLEWRILQLRFGVQPFCQTFASTAQDTPTKKPPKRSRWRGHRAQSGAADSVTVSHLPPDGGPATPRRVRRAQPASGRRTAQRPWAGPSGCS